MAAEKTIMELETYVEQLNPGIRDAFCRIFDVVTDTAFLQIPPSFSEKVSAYVGEAGETEEQACRRVSLQPIVRTYNKYTNEGALFNEMRTSKPGAKPAEEDKIREEITARTDKARKNSDFRAPEKYTAQDYAGEIRRRGCTKRANLVGYDAHNALIIFSEPDPFKLDEQALSDCFGAAEEWWGKMHRLDSSLVYPFLGWNFMKKAGASQDWPHMHALITRKVHYAGVENQVRAMQEYNRKQGDYFKDLFEVHEALGLGMERDKSRLMAYIAPTKDKEVMIVSDRLENLVKPVYETIMCMREKMGAYAFNVGLHIPPLAGTKESADWAGFPYIARFVDRGNPLANGTDIAVMELYGSKVIGSDPFKVMRAFGEYLAQQKSEGDPCANCVETLTGVGGAPCVGCTVKSGL